MNQANNALQQADIANLDLGNDIQKEAKKSCESFEEALKELEVFLKDPYGSSNERISELKNSLKLKREELKLIIDRETNKLINRLEEYERQSKEHLSSNEFKVESKKLDNELKLAQSNLNSWLESLNKANFDEQKWKSIIEESSQELKSINDKSDEFKNNLISNKLDEIELRVNYFKNIKTDPLFEYVPTSINNEFLDSRIINEKLARKLEELLTKKDLNGRKWSLLYQGFRDGFRASDFHSRCDGKPNTLTIIKSKSKNIFGCYVSEAWSSPATVSWQVDPKAFIFSLVNKENRPLIFEHTSNDEYAKHSILLNPVHGPVLGYFQDLIIYDSSNSNKNSCSNLGYTYTHPEYPHGSERTKTILAGTYNFQVQEFEVFQMQQ